MGVDRKERRERRRSIVGTVLVAAAMIGMTAGVVPAAGAATFEVTSGADDGSAGTLRWAVAQAAASPGDDAVAVDPAVTTITLTDCAAGRIDVGGDGSLTIEGGGAVVDQTCEAGVLGTDAVATLVLRDLTVTGGRSANGGGVDAPNGSVTLDRITLARNVASDVGGGVRASTLRIIDSTIRENQARAGGGVAGSGGGPVEISGGTIDHNWAVAGAVPTQDPPEGRGGGVAVLGAEPARISGTRLHDNEAGLQGGAIYSTADLVLEDVVVADNAAVYGGFVLQSSGGGISTGPGSLTVRTSQIRGNLASAAGGFAAVGPVEIRDSTIEDNEAALGYGGGVATTLLVTGSTVTGNRTNTGPGGGLRADALTLLDSAIIGNVSGGFGGGLVTAGPALVRNTTIVGNVAPIDPAIDSYGDLRLELSTLDGNVGDPGTNGGGASAFATAFGVGACAGLGPIASEGHNVAADGGCGLGDPTDLVGVGDLGLGPLGLNDGPTPNHVPASGSPLLNRIPADDARCIGADQRGVTRPQNGACDAGSVEVRAVTAVGTMVSTADGAPVEVDLRLLVTDPDGVLATYRIDAVVGGSADGEDGGVVTYTPDGSGSTGSFTFVVCSAEDVICTDPATVNVTVAAGAAVPVSVTPRLTG